MQSVTLERNATTSSLAASEKDFLGALEHIERLNSPLSRTVRIIAHSPSSDVFKLVADQLDRMARRGIAVRIVFTDIKRKDVDAVFDRFANAFGPDRARSLLRIAAISGADEASEQLQMGEYALWMGEEDTDEGITLHLIDNDLAELGDKVFNQVWDMSQPLPISVSEKFAKRFIAAEKAMARRTAALEKHQAKALAR